MDVIDEGGIVSVGVGVGGAQALQTARKVSLVGEQMRKGTWASAHMKAQQGS